MSAVQIAGLIIMVSSVVVVVAVGLLAGFEWALLALGLFGLVLGVSSLKDSTDG